MKKFLSAFILVTFLAVTASAMFNVSTAGQALLVKANNTSPLEGLGTAVNQNKNMIKCVWDYSVLGGAALTYVNLVDDQGNLCVLPVGAIAVRSYVYVTTAILPTGKNVLFTLLGAGDLKASTSTTTFSIGAPLEGALTGAMTLALAPTTTASTQVKMYPDFALTAGKVNLYIEYVY